MGALISDGIPLWDLLNFFSILFFYFLLHVILYLQHFFWRTASVDCLLANGENVIVYLSWGFFGRFFWVTNSLGRKKLSTFDHNFFTNAFAWKTWT